MDIWGVPALGTTAVGEGFEWSSGEEENTGQRGKKRRKNKDRLRLKDAKNVQP